MAIDQTGATMTGMLNKKPNVPAAPDMSAMKAPAAAPKEEAPKIEAAPVEQESNNTKSSLREQFPDATEIEVVLAERFKTLTAEDRTAISSILSPSVKIALGKIVPEFSPVMENIGPNEPNVVLPLSAISNFATQKYGIADPQEAVNSFLTEVTSLMDQPMETNNVPPSQPTEQAGLMASPQNMETV
jgi:hypothetical protein